MRLGNGGHLRAGPVAPSRRVAIMRTEVQNLKYAHMNAVDTDSNLLRTAILEMSKVKPDNTNNDPKNNHRCHPYPSPLATDWKAPGPKDLFSGHSIYPMPILQV